MSGKMVGWAFDIGRELDLSSTQRYVLVAYCDNANDTGKCWPEKTEIISKTGLSQASVYRAIKALEGLSVWREAVDERGRKCVWVGPNALSHSEKPAAGDSQGEKPDSHSERPYIDEPSEEPVSSEKKSNRTSSPHPVDLIFAAWVESTGKTTRTQLTPQRRRLIERALGWGYPVKDLTAAVQGWRHSPHHRGENDRGTIYNDLALLLRDAGRIEFFRDLGSAAARPPVKPDKPDRPTGGQILIERRRRRSAQTGGAEGEAPQKEAA